MLSLIAVSMLLCYVHFYSDLETLALTPRSVPRCLLLCTVVIYWFTETVSAFTKKMCYSCAY